MWCFENSIQGFDASGSLGRFGTRGGGKCPGPEHPRLAALRRSGKGKMRRDCDAEFFRLFRDDKPAAGQSRKTIFRRTSCLKIALRF